MSSPPFLDNPARHAVDPAAPPAQIAHHLLTVELAARVGVVRPGRR